MNTLEYLNKYPAIASIMNSADDFHAKEVESRKNLREILAATLSYMPGWIRLLYRIRAHLVRFFGVRQTEIPTQRDIAKENVSFVPGEKAAFFTILAAEEERYWIAAAEDAMITGYLGVVLEPLEHGLNRFHFISGAKYRRWTGRLYYNLILPFHHTVIRCMMRNAVK